MFLADGGETAQHILRRDAVIVGVGGAVLVDGLRTHLCVDLVSNTASGGGMDMPITHIVKGLDIRSLFLEIYLLLAGNNLFLCLVLGHEVLGTVYLHSIDVKVDDAVTAILFNHLHGVDTGAGHARSRGL